MYINTISKFAMYNYTMYNYTKDLTDLRKLKKMCEKKSSNSI